MSKKEFFYLFNIAVIGIAGVVFLAVVVLTYAGMFYSFLFGLFSFCLKLCCFIVSAIANCRRILLFLLGEF